MKKRILVINFGGIGDQILFFPALKSLKKTFYNPFITFITEPRSKSTNELTDLIDETFISNLKSGNKFINIFKILVKAFCGKYDIVISSGSSKFVAILLFLTGIKKRIGYDSGALSRILLTDAVPLNQNQYAANMYHDLVFSLCDSQKAELPEIKIDLGHEKRTYIENLICADKKKIVIHPGVSKLSIEKGIIKFWSAGRWAGLIKKLLQSGEYSVILTGGTDDREIYSEIHANLAQQERVTPFLNEAKPPFQGLHSRQDESFNRDYLIDLTDKSFNIKEFAYIVKLSDMLICVDSAPMHIAVGLKKSVVALFGPTDEKKLLPFDNKLFTPVKNDGAACRPCLWHKRQTSCEETTCLNIEIEQVFNVLVEKFLLQHK